MRVAVLGGDGLRASIATLGFVHDEAAAAVAVVDTDDETALRRACELPAETPRVLIASGERRVLLAAAGASRSALIASAEPAVLGPAILGLIPVVPRRPSRVLLVTGVRGGVGRTLCATNLARRIARRARVCLLDATGSGAAAWWLRCAARPWSDLEGLVDEMSADHLAVVAHDAAVDLRLVGGPPVAPSVGIVVATARAAVASDDVVIVDAPPMWDAALPSLRAVADRCLVLSYDDALSVEAVAVAGFADDDWLIASQSRARHIAGHETFRALPRDEPAVAAAVSRRDAVGGALGRAYDELADVLVIDVT